MPIRPPHPRLATHLIAVTPVDNSARDPDYAMQPAYLDEAEVAYIGIVEQGGGVEDDAGIIYSEGVFTCTVFAADDPGLSSQARVRWGPIPPGFALPARGSAGVVTLPEGWVAQKTADATADGSALGPGCWAVQCKATT